MSTVGYPKKRIFHVWGEPPPLNRFDITSLQNLISFCQGFCFEGRPNNARVPLKMKSCMLNTV